MTELRSIYTYIDTHVEEFLEGLKQFLAKPSISSQGIGLRENAEHLKSMMESLNIKTSIVETAGAPIVYGELTVEEDAPTILVYGHYDVQPPEPLDAWISPPFQPTIRNGRIYARGAGDKKGQLHAQLMGLNAIQATQTPLRANIKFIFEGEEESGSPNLERFIRENKRLRADFAYTSDGPLHESGRPVVQLGVRGILYLEFTAKGASKDLHSGNWGGPIANPAWRLIDLLTTMREPHTGRVLIEGFYDKIREPTEEEERVLEKIPLNLEKIARDLGLEPSRLPSTPSEFYHKLMFEPTFNICGIYSGYTGKGMKTIIPSTATLKLDIRLVADQDPEDIFLKVQRHVEKHAPDVQVRRLGQMRPSRTPLDNRYVRVVCDAVEKATGLEPLIYLSLGGSLPDYVFTGILGIPSIMVPYANIDESNHAPNENLEVKLYTRGIKCFATLLALLSQKHRA